MDLFKKYDLRGHNFFADGFADGLTLIMAYLNFVYLKLLCEVNTFLLF